MRFAKATVCFTLLIGMALISGCPQDSTPAGSGAPSATVPASKPPKRTGRDGHPALGIEPPEVVAADWLNTDTPQSLAGLRGNVVLVEFWATWCGPCVAGIPHLNEMQARLGDQGLRILSFTDEDRRKVEKFQKNAKVPIEYTVGLGSSLSAVYGVRGIPHAFVIGRDGKLAWHGHPADPECEEKIVAALAHK